MADETKLDLDGVTKREIVALLEDLYVVCLNDRTFAKGKKGEMMDKVQKFFIDINLLVPYGDD